MQLNTQYAGGIKLIFENFYSGPLYHKFNSSLRKVSRKFDDSWTDHLEGNTYANNIYACSSCLRKTSQCSSIPRGRKVFRGFGGVQLPEALKSVKEGGGCGGLEFGFMSTTTSKDVAVSYIGGKALPVLMEIDVGDIDRGASLSYLSQYPSEVSLYIYIYDYM